MALDPALVTELRRILGRYRVAHGISAVPTGAGKALEAWLLMRLAEKARQSGAWTVTLRRADETPLPLATAFELPTSQAGISPSSRTGPCHVLLKRVRDGLLFELHGSLQWKGRSDATHECDVSVLPGVIATTLRSHGGGHPHGLPVAAYECKDRATVGHTDEMRQTIARMFDLALVTRPLSGASCRICANTSGGLAWGTRSSSYRSFFARGAFGVVRVGGFSAGARRLGHHYYVERNGDVYTRPATILEIEASWMKLLDEIDLLI